MATLFIQRIIGETGKKYKLYTNADILLCNVASLAKGQIN